MADNSSNLFLNIADKKQDMALVAKRIDREVNKFYNVHDSLFLDGESVDESDSLVLDNMVLQYGKNLAFDYANASKYNDKELEDFFNICFSKISVLQLEVYYLNPQILDNKVKNYMNKIQNGFNVCEDRLEKGRNIDTQLNDINALLTDFKTLISLNLDKRNGKNADKLNEILEKAGVVHNVAMEKFNKLKMSNNDIINNKKSNTSSKKNVNVYLVLDKYIKNLTVGKNAISKVYDDSGKYIEGVYEYLCHLKSNNLEDSYIENVLIEIRKDLLDKYAYDIESNRIKDKKSNKKATSTEKKEASNSNTKDDNAYNALRATINSYINDFGGQIASIKNNSSINDIDLKYRNYKEMLGNLIEDIDGKRRNLDDIRNDFSNLTENIKKDLGYVYKSNVSGRNRKILDVKRIGFGAIGSFFGIYGVSSLINELAFFSKFGFLYPSMAPFILPVSMTLAGGLLLKAALTKEGKGVLQRIWKKMKAKQADSINEEEYIKRR